MTMDRLKYPILYVDDEPENLVAFRYAMEGRFRIITARSGEEALELLAREPIAVLLCDQRMPGMTGVELCRRAREVRPDTARMLVTAYSNVDAVIGAINEGKVSRFILKPWRNEELEQVLDAAIEIAHLNATVRDLQQRLSAGSRKRVALAATAELLHELANPLAAMTMALAEAAELAERVVEATGSSKVPELADTDLLQQILGDFGAGVVQLNAILQRVREDRGQESVAGRCDLGVVTASAVRMTRRLIERQARLAVVVADELMVGLEASVAAEIALNLIVNAWQAIEASGLKGRTIRVTVERDHEHALLIVDDDGPGIAPAQLGLVFEARYSTRGAGRGLGLSIARELAWRAGGTIDVTSELGRGARFEVRLPLDLSGTGQVGSDA